MNTQPKKRGRPVGSKTKSKNTIGSVYLRKLSDEAFEEQMVKQALPLRGKTKKDYDKAWEDFMIPTPKELGMHRGNNKMSLPNKITLVLTVVNVAILISLVIKNVWMNF